MADRTIDGRNNPLYWDRIVDALQQRYSILIDQAIELYDRHSAKKTELGLVDEGLASIDRTRQRNREDREIIENENRAGHEIWDEVSLMHLNNALDENENMLSARRNSLVARRQVLEDSLHELQGMVSVCEDELSAACDEWLQAQAVRDNVHREYY